MFLADGYDFNETDGKTDILVHNDRSVSLYKKISNALGFRWRSELSDLILARICGFG